jgi:hypothetical protein
MENQTERPSSKYFTWVEGYEELEMTDTKAWVNVAWEVMPGWKVLAKSRFKLKDISGLGGSKTYLINSNPKSSDKTPAHPSIVLRARKRTQDEDPYQEVRMETSQKVLYDHGLAIPRLFEGRTFTIEPCVEDARPKLGWFKKLLMNVVCAPIEKGEVSKFAKLLAKIHQVPTDWFEPIREDLQKKYPLLQSAVPGSHVWIATSRMEWWGTWRANMTEEVIRFYLDATREPLSAAGKRVVTSHGDYHDQNVMIEKSTGNYLAIDLEFTTVQYAAGGLGYVFGLSQYGCDTAAGKRAFIKEYLKASELPCEPADVDLLIFDAECAKIRHHWTAGLTTSMWCKLKWNDFDFKCYKMIAEFEDQCRSDKQLQKKVVEMGFYEQAMSNPKRKAAV